MYIDFRIFFDQEDYGTGHDLIPDSVTMVGTDMDENDLEIASGFLAPNPEASHAIMEAAEKSTRGGEHKTGM